MPSIERLRSALAGQPFAVLAVNLAEPRSRIEKFLQHLPIGFAVLLDRDTQAAKDWDARVLPETACQPAYMSRRAIGYRTQPVHREQAVR